MKFHIAETLQQRWVADPPSGWIASREVAVLSRDHGRMLGYLRVSKRNLYCWRMAGLIPYFKIGRAVRFRKAEVDAALERMRME